MSGPSGYLLKRFKSLRVSDVKALMTCEKTRYETFVLYNAQYRRIVFAERPVFKNIIRVDNMGTKFLWSDAIKLHIQYNKMMRESASQVTDPKLGDIWDLLKLCAAVAALLAAAMTEEEKQEKMLKDLEAALERDRQELADDQGALDDLKLTKQQLDKDVETWWGSIVEMYAGQRAKTIKEIAKLEGEIDRLNTAITSERRQIGQIKLDRLIMEISL